MCGVETQKVGNQLQYRKCDKQFSWQSFSYSKFRQNRRKIKWKQKISLRLEFKHEGMCFVKLKIVELKLNCGLEKK